MQNSLAVERKRG